MTGLLLKDILYLKNQFRLLLILFVFYAVILFTTSSHIEQFNAVFDALIVMFPMIIITNAFAYDETSKWNTYSLSLPVAKNGIVLAKYLLLIILICSGAILPIIENIATGNLVEETLVGIYAACAIGITLCSILIPLFYQFGTQKARIVLMIFVMIPTIGSLLLKDTQLSVPSEATILFWLKLSPVILVLIFLCSYFLSCYIFEKKDV